MKKKVLLSVFAASLFAAPVALAADNFQPVAPGPNHFDGANYGDNSADFKLTDVTQGEVNDSLTATSKAKTAKANGQDVVDYKDRVAEGKLVGKGKAAPKAGANKPAGKVLPKTSAAK